LQTCLLDRVTGTDAVDWENPECADHSADASTSTN